MSLSVYRADVSYTYRGNPDSLTSAIDTSGGIACSRTSAEIPAFVQVSASAIAGTGLISAYIALKPYQDFQYSWDFGDPSGVETFTCPAGSRAGQTLNANSDQRGPEAAYVYRTAGTYTITLTIRYRNSNGTISRRTVTQSFVASAFNASGGTYYFDSVSGNDANDGLSSGAPKQTISAINTVAGTTHRRIYLKRGSSWTGTTQVKGYQRWDVYGSGAKPIIDRTMDSAFTFTCLVDSTDIVVSNLDIRSQGAGSTAIWFTKNDNNGLSDIYFDNVTGNDLLGGGPCTIQGVSANCGLWKCDMTSQPAAWAGIGPSQFYGGAHYWQFFVGCAFAGAGGHSNGTSVLGHHVYDQVREHSLYQWQTHGVGTGLRYCINANHNPAVAGVTEYPRWHSRVECDLSGTGVAGLEFSSAADPDDVRYKDVVIQDCETSATNRLIYDESLSDATIRDSYIYNMTDDLVIALNQETAQLRIYRNLQHHASGIGGTDPAFVGFFNTGTAWTTAQQVVDNIIVDMRSSAEIISLVSSEHTNSLIDRNQYYFPSDSNSKAFEDNGAEKSFAQWQALGFDGNGSVADPGWTDGANGDFS